MGSKLPKIYIYIYGFIWDDDDDGCFPLFEKRKEYDEDIHRFIDFMINKRRNKRDGLNNNNNINALVENK